jgi:hypothetical protein
MFEQLENPFPLGCQTTTVLVEALLQRSIGGSRRGGQRHRSESDFSIVVINERL